MISVFLQVLISQCSRCDVISLYMRVFVCVQVSATDLDCGHSETIAYSIVTPSDAAELTMQPSSGRLCIRSALDYERKRQYEFEIAATDQGA